jgi:hypothetical protein
MRADKGACLTIRSGMVFYSRFNPVLIEYSTVFGGSQRCPIEENPPM